MLTKLELIRLNEKLKKEGKKMCSPNTNLGKGQFGCSKIKSLNEFYFCKSICKVCENIKSKNYWEENKEKISEYKKNYDEEHKREIEKYSKNYNNEHKEEKTEYGKNNRVTINGKPFNVNTCHSELKEIVKIFIKIKYLKKKLKKIREAF